MVKQLSIIVLFLGFPFSIFSQEQKFEDFHFIEAGIGTSHGQTMHGAVNIGITNSLNSVWANFIDYNLGVDKSDVLFHEFNFKIGPYYRFNRYSYMAISSGLSFIFNSKPEYNNFYRSNTLQTKNDDFMFCIPIQGRLNISIYKGFCIGLKGTYSKIIFNSWANTNDKSTVLMYLAFGF